jgi:hypothetical protein
VNLAIALSGLIFPGLGHALLGKRARAAVFFVVLSSLFFTGVFLEREFYFKFGPGLLATPPQDTIPIRDHRGDELEGNVDKIWKVIFVYGYPFFVGFGNYAIGLKWTAMTAPLVKAIPGVLKPDEIPVTTRDIGYCFALLSGLLNLLVMMDAYDISCNEEELRRRDQAKKEKAA